MPSWEEDEDLTAQCELHSEPRPLCGTTGPLPSRGGSQSPGSDLLCSSSLTRQLSSSNTIS